MSRPFGAGATVAAGNGTVVENSIPREMAPVQEPEQIGEWEPQPVTESAPAPFTAPDSQPVSDLTPGSFSEISELVSAPEWEFAPVRTETASSYEGAAQAPQEMSTIAETSAALDAPAALEAPVCQPGQAPVWQPELQPLASQQSSMATSRSAPARPGAAGEPLGDPYHAVLGEQISANLGDSRRNLFERIISGLVARRRHSIRSADESNRLGPMLWSSCFCRFPGY
jgi:hypothetical protein